MPTNSEEEECDTVDCYSCGDEIDEGDVIHDDGDSICQACYDSREEDRSSEQERSQYINDHDYKPAPLFHNDNGKRSREPALVNTFPKPYVGIEIEVESTRSSVDLGNYAEMVHDNCGGLVYNKTDGSINHGFEMVTHPMTLGYAQNHLDGLWSSFTLLRKAGFRAWQTSTCGLHIHISRNSFLDE